MENPFLKTVSLTDNVKHSLESLLTAAGFPVAAQPNNPGMIEFTVDLAGPSDGYLYIGNADVSTTMWGKKLVPGVLTNWAGFLAPCSIKNIYLLTDSTVSGGSPLLVGVSIVQR